MISEDGWKKSDWLGYFYDSGTEWIYHETFGWMFVHDPGNGSTWLYHLQLGWIWSRPEIYPWLYFENLSEWRYFLATYGFYNPSDSSWTSTESFSVDSSDSSQSAVLIGQKSTTKDSSSADGWSQINSTVILIYLQGNSSFVINYRTQDGDHFEFGWSV